MQTDLNNPEIAKIVYKERLNAIAVSYYTLAVPMILTGLVFIIYIFMGLMFLMVPDFANDPELSRPSSEFASALVGSVFLIMGSIMTFSHCILGALLILSGIGMQKFKWRTLTIVASILSLLFLPFGTVAGVFALLTLFKPEVKTMYQEKNQASLTT